MFRKALLVAALLGLVGCGTANAPYASDAEVQSARYVHGGPTAITLFTVVNAQSGGGAHSGLLINGSERLIFDPAGTWQHPRLPERNDVHFGMTDRMVAFYIDYHARVTYNVIEQTVLVSPAVAELAIARAKAYGAVPKAHCANSVSSILRGVPGFENLPSTFFPVKLSEAFAELPGASYRLITDTDADDNHGVLLIDPEKPKPGMLAQDG